MTPIIIIIVLMIVVVLIFLGIHYGLWLLGFAGGILLLIFSFAMLNTGIYIPDGFNKTIISVYSYDNETGTEAVNATEISKDTYTILYGPSNTIFGVILMILSLYFILKFPLTLVGVEI